MPRSPRLEYAGALYHVTSRGVRQAPIFADNRDREHFLRILAEKFGAHDAQAFAFCLMGNHYHLVLQTRRANLSKLMFAVNGRHGIAFNLRHGRQGHLFEGRFKALHVDREPYLLRVCRYVDLNPVRAGLVRSPEQWGWSSYRAHAGDTPLPDWLASHELLEMLTGRPCADREEFASAQRCYGDWVRDGQDERLWETAVRQRLYVGDAAFVERLQRLRT